MVRNASGYGKAWWSRRDAPHIEILDELILESSQSRRSSSSSLLHPIAVPLNIRMFDSDRGPLEQEEKVIPLKKKRKTRGVARQPEDQRQENRMHEEQEAMHPELLRNEQGRRAGLQRVNELRRQYPINVRTIRRELDTLANFLPLGRIEGVTANVFKISWHPPEGRPVSLNFEMPHGNDHTVFRGNKLDWALNTLELGYLHGWDARQIRAYIEENDRHNLLRLPQYIMFIFGNRPVQRM